jgi:hypothetical protein
MVCTCIPTDTHELIHKGTLLRSTAFSSPCTALFFNSSPAKLIVACYNDMFIVDMSTQSTQPFISTPQGAHYCPHALALSDDDAVLVAGSSKIPFSVCGYDTASRTRLWISNTANSVGAVCMLGARVLVTVHFNPTLVLDRNKGKEIAALQKADGCIYGLGVTEGMFHSVPPLNPQTFTHPCT